MADDESIDPFTQTHRAIRQAILDWPALTGPAGMVRLANIPDLTVASFLKLNLGAAPADLPEVAIVQGQFKLMPFGRNSMTCSADQSYPLLVSHGQLSLLKPNRLKMALLGALLMAGDNLGIKYVRQWDVTQGVDSIDRAQEPARQNRGWVSVMQVNVQLDLPRQFVLNGSI